ncbi:MAG: hypothetical protein GDA43_07905 [Hormoscilla sp. SP5CHS1]|nr:hypothetical protein [Hormoscilla sp. SP5CHS1]
MVQDLSFNRHKAEGGFVVRVRCPLSFPRRSLGTCGYDVSGVVRLALLCLLGSATTPPRSHGEAWERAISASPRGGRSSSRETSISQETAHPNETSPDPGTSPDHETRKAGRLRSERTFAQEV